MYIHDSLTSLKPQELIFPQNLSFFEGGGGKDFKEGLQSGCTHYCERVIKTKFEQRPWGTDSPSATRETTETVPGPFQSNLKLRFLYPLKYYPPKYTLTF